MPEKTIVPFITSSKSGNGVFGNAVEKAAVFCLAELGREKGGGFFRKQAPEKLVFAAEICYPFWLTPFRSYSLLFDGLNLMSHAMTYAALPDPEAFRQEMTESSETRQIYANFLANHQNYFENSSREETKVIEGLIADVQFLPEFMEYFKEAKVTEAPVVDCVLVTPAFDEKGIMSNVQDLENSRSKLAKELEDLNKIIVALNSKTQHFLAEIREEIKAIEKRFGVQIEKAKASLEIETSKINEEYAEMITEVAAKYEKNTLELQKEIIRLEKTQQQMNSEIEQIDAEIKFSAINKDDEAEENWKEKKSKLKKELPEIAARVEDLNEQIQETDVSRKNEIFQLQQDNDGKIKEAQRELVEIESSRDAEIMLSQAEMEKLEELTAGIIAKIDYGSKAREAAVAEFDALGIRQNREHPTLVYMPFYLLCYRVGSNKRYAYLAPSVVASSDGIGVRLKAVGKSKISVFFQPRSKKIVSIINSFVRLLDENVVFSHEINEACSKANMFSAKNVGETIMKGLDELKAEGWVSDGEHKSFSRVLASMVS